MALVGIVPNANKGRGFSPAERAALIPAPVSSSDQLATAYCPEDGTLMPPGIAPSSGLGSASENLPCTYCSGDLRLPERLVLKGGVQRPPLPSVVFTQAPKHRSSW